MDWEACPNEIKKPIKPTLFSSQATKPSEPSGGKFLFNPPKGIIPPPYTAPITSPAQLHPESFGLKHRPRSTMETDADTSLESLQSSSKLYSSNGVKHEERRRRQRNLRSKLSQMNVQSDDESNDQSSDDGRCDQPASRSLVRSRSRSPAKAGRSTTHNHLTIHGWNPSDNASTPAPQSQLATDTPYILLVYLQLLFNASLVGLALYLSTNFILMMRTDINHRMAIQTAQIRQEIEHCTTEYNTNNCWPLSKRTKFLEQPCIEWERCMARNPNLLSKSKIGAETFAEVMNGFVDLISWKTMVRFF